MSAGHTQKNVDANLPEVPSTEKPTEQTAEQKQKEAEKDNKPKSDAPANDCLTGNCDEKKDCECYCNKPIDEAVLAAVTSEQTFLGKSRVEFIALLNQNMATYEITECIDKAHFLAHAAHESLKFKRTVEMKHKVITKDKKGKETTSYEWTKYSGGSFYHGRGYIQLTHDHNYKKYLGSSMTNEDVESIGSDVDKALDSSCWFWKKGSAWGDLSVYAKQNNLNKTCRGINGGLNGLPDRKLLLEKVGKALKIECCVTYKKVWGDGNGIK